MSQPDGSLARVAIPFGAVVRYPSDGIVYRLDGGIPALSAISEY